MLNLVAFTLVNDVMHQQFQTKPLRAEANAPRVRWNLQMSTWTHPIALALRHTADVLDPLEAPVAFVS